MAIKSKLKTHEVLDLFYTVEEGQGTLIGTLEECNKFITEQGDASYVINPLTDQQIKDYPDNQQYL